MQKPYAPLPTTAIDVELNDTERRERRDARYRKTFIQDAIAISIVLIICAIGGTKWHWFDDFMPMNMKASTTSSTSTSPTLLPGGGRDWIVDVDKGVITSKHDPKFALGALPHDPLILTTRDEDNVIYFPKEELSKLQDNGSSSLSSLTLQFPSHVDKFSIFNYILAGGIRAHSEGSDSDSGAGLNVEYIDHNFILFGGEFALDVNLWKMVKGNKVNFVQVDKDAKFKWWEKKQQTLQYGGGRDWVLNIHDGTISPKNAPSLVLGRGVRTLALIDIDQTPQGVLHFDNLNLLGMGEPARLVDRNRGDVVGKMKQEETNFREWRYIESRIFQEKEDEAAIQVKYIDKNYLAVYEEGQEEEKALVLDVSFWEMIPYNTVNFVGGWVYEP
mmetsp:Transcript_6952/g.8012  ORF Transcript_6952/g.8012 Transcript_6952/m.8012 type:complete len:387 (-) Transcript_6952:132-1292(-)